MANPSYPVEFPTNSTFVPTSYGMFEILHQMHLCVANNTYLIRINNKYMPLLSRLYYGVMFNIQTLRAMRSAHGATVSQRRFLESFENEYPLESLPVAGPLVNYFDSIIAYKPEGDRYQYVHPTFPDLTGLKGEVAYSSSDLRTVKLVNIPALLTMIQILRKTKRNAKAPNGFVHEDTDIWYPIDDFYPGGDKDRKTYSFGALKKTTDSDQQRALLQMYVSRPGPNHAIETDFDNLMSVAMQLKKLTDLPEPDGEDDLSTVAGQCYLSEDMSWFQHCVSAAVSESNFFLGGKNFSQILTTGSSAITVRSEAIPLKQDFKTGFKNTILGFYVPAIYQPEAHSFTITENSSPDDQAIGKFNQLHYTTPDNAVYVAQSVSSTRKYALGAAPAGERPPYYEHNSVFHESGRSLNPYAGMVSIIRNNILVPKGIETRPN